MVLDADVKAQLEQYLQLLEDEVQINICAEEDKVSRDMLALIAELSSISSKIKVVKKHLHRTPSFSVNRIGENTGITFAGIPLGHEFTSLILAILQVSGRPPKIDEQIIEKVKSIKGEYHFETYISLTCQSCPNVVQALNLMSVLNPNISHTMVDGSTFRNEVEQKNIIAIPTVFMNGEYFGVGQLTLEEILSKLGTASE